MIYEGLMAMKWHGHRMKGGGGRCFIFSAITQEFTCEAKTITLTTAIKSQIGSGFNPILVLTGAVIAA